MESGNFSPHALALYNYKLFESFKRLAESPNDDSAKCILSLNDLYELIDNNFAELHNKQNLMNLLPILHYTIQLSISKDAPTKIDTCAFFQMLLIKHKHNEDNQRLALQLYYQLLKSLQNYSNHSISITDELFQTLNDLLFSGSHNLAANVLNCLKIQIAVYKRSDVLDRLWLHVSKMVNNENSRERLAQILVQLIDNFLQYFQNFCNNEIFIKIVLLLLGSGIREERKIAIYLLKKIIPSIIKRAQDVPIWEVNYSEELDNSWNSYTAVLDNLEEKQSHLILPTLEKIKNIKLAKMWLDLLYTKLLTHNNSLVLRWTIEYMLDNFVCKELSRELLKCFLEAANTTNLYNYDNYCLPKDKVKTFLNCDLKVFFEVCADINWKSVPLIFWLYQLYPKLSTKNQFLMSSETLIKIASRVRALQNLHIRKYAIGALEYVFKANIEALHIDEYLQFVESLYNVSDCYMEKRTLTKKLVANCDMLPELKFTQRLYEIINMNSESFSVEEQNSILDAFEMVPKEHHHWFRFMFVFDFKKNDKQLKFCHDKYDLDFSKIYSLDELTSKVVDKLVWDKSEISFVQEKAVDFFVMKHTNLNQLLEASNFSLEELLEKGGACILEHISELATESNEVINVADLDKILKIVKCTPKQHFNIYLFLLNSIVENLQVDDVLDYMDYVQLILDCDDDDAGDDLFAHNALFCLGHYPRLKLIHAYISKNLINHPENTIHKIFHKKATHGDARVEERFLFDLGCQLQSNLRHYALVEYINAIRDLDVNIDFLNYLLKVNNDVSKTKARYFENSHEHRVKMRVASCALRLIRSSPYEWRHKLFQTQFWDIIFCQKNQLNITYCYERIIAYCSPNVDTILDYLRLIAFHPPSQQVSIIVICCNYCLLNMSELAAAKKKEILEYLLPLTMGPNFQIRLYSQLAIYKMLVDSEATGIFVNNAEQLKETIELVVGDQLEDLLEDIRIDVNQSNILDDDIVFYVSNAPFDEVSEFRDIDYLKKTYAKCKEQFGKKINTSQKMDNTELNSCTEINDVQRKMNPLTDIIPDNNLLSYPEFKTKKENDVIVVASLIDKLPNLGGIARTCEVLGIRNLVMSSSQHIHKDDFKNLSMTAEKGLNIIEIKQANLMEFIVRKQFEGYEIVGAEQTARSQSFVDFKFPKKCIILLGHEKEGIPANILSILNHTVEIPQFGIVRSLNVHVTGALFMWEYCKQHIIQS